jgi:hypothetical protein
MINRADANLDWKCVKGVAQDAWMYKRFVEMTSQNDICKEFKVNSSYLQLALDRHGLVLHNERMLKIKKDKVAEQLAKAQARLDTSNDKFVYESVHHSVPSKRRSQASFETPVFTREKVRQALKRHRKHLESEENQKNEQIENKFMDRLKNSALNPALRPFSAREFASQADKFARSAVPEKQPKIGRPVAINDQVTTIALKSIQTGGLKSTGTNGEIERKNVAGVLLSALREDNRKNNIGNSNSQLKVTPYITNKWMKIHMLPDANSKYRNNRTIRAQADLGNGIAQYMVLSAIMEGTARDGKVQFDPRLVASIDCVTVLLSSGKPGEIMVLKSVKPWLKKHNRASTRTVGEGSATSLGRCIKLHNNITLAGFCRVSILIITDYGFSESTDVHSLGNNNGTSFYLIFIQARMSIQKQEYMKKSLGIVLEDEDPSIGANENDDDENAEFFETDDDEVPPLSDAFVFPKLDVYTNLKVFDKPISISQKLSLTQQNRIILDIVAAVTESDRTEIQKEKERVLAYDDPSVFKQCGGCSGVYQMNDTGKMHAKMKETSKNTSFKSTVEPPFLHHIMKEMKNKGMKGKSLLTYESFLANLFFIFARSMTRAMVDIAWEAAGIINGKPNKLKILGAISTYNNLLEPDLRRVDSAMDLLQEYVDYHLKVNEIHMQELIGDILNTDIDPIRPKTIGQERAMVLTCPAQIQERKRRIDLKIQEVAAKQAADQAKATKKALKAAAILKDATELAQLGVLLGPPSSSMFCQNPSCISGIIVPVSLADSVKAGLWKGCPSCPSPSWFCGNSACQKLLRTHRSICNQKRSVFVGSPEAAVEIEH